MATIGFKVLFPLVAVMGPLIATGSANAQHMNATDAPCKRAGSGVEQVNCLSAAAKKADSDLNQAYQRITSVLDSGKRQQLQGAERTWITYRDQTCAAERNLYDGGTGGNAAYAACLEAVTRHRLADLKSAYWWRVEKFGG